MPSTAAEAAAIHCLVVIRRRSLASSARARHRRRVKRLHRCSLASSAVRCLVVIHRRGSTASRPVQRAERRRRRNGEGVAREGGRLYGGWLSRKTRLARNGSAIVVASRAWIQRRHSHRSHRPSLPAPLPLSSATCVAPVVLRRSRYSCRRHLHSRAALQRREEERGG